MKRKQRLEASDPCPQVRLMRADGVWAELTYYAPRVVHPPHRHDHLQISFLLAGAFQESDGDATLELLGGETGVKPPGFLHDDTYGVHGALILAINIDSAVARRLDDAPRAARRWGWIRSGVQAPANLWARLADNSAGGHASAWAGLSTAGEGRSPTARSAPVWLREARRRIDAMPTARLRDIARHAGVHRVVLSRVFRRHFGITPSEYRRRLRLARAVQGCIVGRESLCHVAHDAGFADQAHFCRELRAFVGLQPSVLRRLLGDLDPVTPVQVFSKA